MSNSDQKSPPGATSGRGQKRVSERPRGVGGGFQLEEYWKLIGLCGKAGSGAEAKPQGGRRVEEQRRREASVRALNSLILKAWSLG